MQHTDPLTAPEAHSVPASGCGPLDVSSSVGGSGGAVGLDGGGRCSGGDVSSAAGGEGLGEARGGITHGAGWVGEHRWRSMRIVEGQQLYLVV